MENGKIEKISEIKCQVFKKINKIDRLLDGIRKKIETTKIRKESSGVTTDSTEIGL